MDWGSWLSAAWDKGAWCVVAVLLMVGAHKFLQWLKPFIERLIEAFISLIKSLETSGQQHATANATHAEANAANAAGIKALAERPACAATQQDFVLTPHGAMPIA